MWMMNTCCRKIVENDDCTAVYNRFDGEEKHLLKANQLNSWKQHAIVGDCTTQPRKHACTHAQQRITPISTNSALNHCAMNFRCAHLSKKENRFVRVLTIILIKRQ